MENQNICSGLRQKQVSRYISSGIKPPVLLWHIYQRGSPRHPCTTLPRQVIPPSSTHPERSQHPSSTHLIPQVTQHAPHTQGHSTTQQEGRCIQNTLQMLEKSTSGKLAETWTHASKNTRPSYRLSEWEKSANPSSMHSNTQHRTIQDNTQLITPINNWHTRRVREAIEVHPNDTVA